VTYSDYGRALDRTSTCSRTTRRGWRGWRCPIPFKHGGCLSFSSSARPSRAEEISRERDRGGAGSGPGRSPCSCAKPELMLSDHAGFGRPGVRPRASAARGTEFGPSGWASRGWDGRRSAFPPPPPYSDPNGLVFGWWGPTPIASHQGPITRRWWTTSKARRFRGRPCTSAANTPSQIHEPDLGGRRFGRNSHHARTTPRQRRARHPTPTLYVRPGRNRPHHRSATRRNAGGHRQRGGTVTMFGGARRERRRSRRRGGAASGHRRARAPLPCFSGPRAEGCPPACQPRLREVVHGGRGRGYGRWGRAHFGADEPAPGRGERWTR